MTYVKAYSVQLVRDSSVKVETRLADSSEKIAPIVRAYIGETPKEHFVVLFMDARNRIIGINTASVGTLNASLCHPREVFQAAILASAAGIVVSHNHPSGDPTPSPEDREVTRRLVRAGEILGIPLLDHVIVTADSFYSFRTQGLL